MENSNLIRNGQVTERNAMLQKRAFFPFRNLKIAFKSPIKNWSMRTMESNDEIIWSRDSIVQLSPELIERGNKNIDVLQQQIVAINHHLEIVGVDINSLQSIDALSPNSIMLPPNYMDNADYDKRIEEIKNIIAEHEKMLRKIQNEKSTIVNSPVNNHRMLLLETQITNERCNIFRYKRELQFHLTSRVPVDAAHFRAHVDELMNQKLRLLELLHEYRRRGFLVNMSQ